MLTLFVPLTLAALGIVLRGSSFAFRKAVFAHRRAGATSAPRSRSSSVLVPYCMGAVAGAIASGRVPAGGKAGDPWTAGSTRRRSSAACSRSPSCAYLAAVYLVWDARRLERRRRWSSTSAAARSSPRSSPGVVAFAGIFVLHADARVRLRRPDVARAAARDRLGAVRHRLARAARARARTAARGCSRSARSRPSWSGWGVAQWPYILPESLKVVQAAAPVGHARAVLVVFVVAAVVILPSLGLLYCSTSATCSRRR